MFHDVVDEDEDDDDDLNPPDAKDDEYFDGRLCEDTEFECGDDHACIPLEKYCDSVEDCSDGSDEKNCASTPRISYSNRTDASGVHEGDEPMPKSIWEDGSAQLKYFHKDA